MKTKYFLLSAIFAFCGLTAHAQVYEMYSQGFEPGEQANYSCNVASSARRSSTIHNSGDRSLKLVQSSSQNVEFILDTLDFTQNTSLRYIALYFDHICRIPQNGPSDNMMGMIYYRRPNQSEWIPVTSQEYNMAGEYSTYFASMGAFCEEAYADSWRADIQPAVSNEQWKSERFDLDNAIPASVAPNERKLLIKYVLRQRTLTSALDTVNKSWWIDNIRVAASSERMVAPKITMLDYPEMEEYPSSRGVRIMLQATTTVASGINPDSVYLYYTVGSDTTRHRLSMPLVTGSTNTFACRIPYYGYDTLMRFYCVVRDATGNANMSTFPTANNSWLEYRCVRGQTVQPGLVTPQFTGVVDNNNSQWFPFPDDCDHKSEFVYDSALMVAAGYGPGAITSLRFTLGANNNNERTIPHIRIRMDNVPGDYVNNTDGSNYYYTNSFMHTVYDGQMTIPVLTSGLDYTINLQDTFFYAGKGLRVQVIYDGTVNAPSFLSVKMIPTNNDIKSFFTYNINPNHGFNPFTSTANAFSWASVMQSAAVRPAFIFNETSLLPLLYDAGVSELVSPNYNQAMTATDHSITVKLKNFGANPFTAVRISYNIDDAVFGHYDWSGNLAAGQETNVLVNSNVPLAPGFHTLKVWVEDSLTSGGQLYRDHEPYNDTSFCEFIVCDGPLSGVRNIGGNNADFNTIEEFLFSLSSCGIDDSLVVRLAPGAYPAFTMPAVNGLSEQHYIVFESMTSNRARIYSDEQTSQNSIVNLVSVANVRMRDIDFVRRSGALTDMVTLGVGSTNCRIERCNFVDSLPNPPAALRIGSMVNTGYANGLVIDECTFVGGRVGVDLKGQAPDIRSANNVVKNCVFNNQYENAIKAENQDNVTVLHNELYDVYSNSGYVVQLNTCYNSRMEGNKIYTSHGAGGLGISDLIGTDTNHALVANNMIVCADDGTANLQRSPLNIIQANYVDVVYNSVKMVAPTRNNVATTTFGGGPINNSRFINNIVVSLDNTNYAFSFQPGTSSSNTVLNNVYYSMGPVLNRKGTSSYATIQAWQVAVPEDSLSISVNPNFLNGSLVDLRTYNRAVKGIGIPIAAVPTDMFDTVRGDSATCPGAFEFSSLPYDFEVEALLNPSTDNCNLPSQVELVVLLRNSGTQPYDATGTTALQLYYKVNNNAVNTITVNRSVPGEDTVEYHTGQMLTLPPSGIQDATYTLRVWNSFPLDPNPTNDTNVFSIVSRYHPAAPAAIVDSIAYNTSTTIVPTNGIDTWQVYNNAGAPRGRSSIYWYNDSLDTEPFLVGDSMTTDVLQSDRVYYISQRRMQPIVRITQVELLRGANAVGLSSPMPYWMIDNRKAAVQLTNIGDATAYLEGDTLMTVSSSTSLNNKVYVFGNVKIEPGQSLVVQYVGNGVSDTNFTVRTGLTPTFSATSKVAFIYRHGGVVTDAVAIDPTTTASTQWTSQNVPSYVWSGPGLQYPQNTAGIIRTAFNGGVGDWEFSTANFPMSLGSTTPSWIRYSDNGCPGDKARVLVAIIAPPALDVAVGAPQLPESACGLGNENITVELHNFGFDTIDSVALNYCVGNDTVVETFNGTILPYGETSFTFSTPVNLAFPTDTTIAVRVWANSLVGDPVSSNDTNVVYVTSLFTPAMPDIIPTRLVQYATSDTIVMPDSTGVIPVWYDYYMNPVDTGFTHITELLYGPGTRGMAYMATTSVNGQIGTGVTTNGNSVFPSPYQPAAKFVKQQYIYTAYELRQSGLVPGNITNISFYLDSIVTTNQSVTFHDYTIALGQTEDTIFTGNSNWKEASSVVFQQNTFTISQNDEHTWVSHNLIPFVWDGESSIVVQISYELTDAVSPGMRTTYTVKTNTTLHKTQSTALSPSTSEYVGTGTRGSNRPNVRFGNVFYSCVGPMRTFDVTLFGMPEHDATAFWTDGNDTMVYNSCDTVDLPVVIRNQGSQSIDTLVLYYSIDGMAVDSTVVYDTIAPGFVHNVSLFRRQLDPGRHHVMAYVKVAGDTIPSNDTVSQTLTVRFCGGNYTIAQGQGADYTSFGEAIDTLNVVGVLGPVTFMVGSGTYNEQVVINNVNGSSDQNVISFIGQGDDVKLTASTSQADSYVMKLDGVSNIVLKNIHFDARPVANNVNYAQALVMMNDSNVVVDSCFFKVKGTIVNANASGIVLQGNVSDLTVRHSVLDSGYYAIRHMGTTTAYSGIRIYNNVFNNFSSNGINLRGVSNLTISDNEFRSGNSSDNRGLIAIYVADNTDSLRIEKNQIYLVDQRKGAKRGIQLENAVGTVTNPVMVVNNMIGTHSTDSKGLTTINSKTASAGIVIDSSSAYVDVFYNTVRIYGTNAVNAAGNDMSYAFWCGNTPSNIMVMNNIFSNFSLGYALYVSELNTVTTSNFNAYYSAGTKKFAWKQNAIGSLTALQMANSDDANSVFAEPYFVDDDSDLHLSVTNFADMAQYNTEVVDDIDGNLRPQIPNPTIGAHEKERLSHDMAVARIISPVMPANIQAPNNIETDSVLVKATFSNNGLSNELNVMWYAYIVGHESTTRSANRNLGNFAPSQMKTDSLMMPTQLGITDTQQVRVVVILNNDITPADNQRDATFFLAPAFNLAAERVEATNSYVPSGCRMQNTQIRIHVKNAGSKPFPAGTSFKIGYHTELNSTSYPDIPTLPDTVEQMVTLTNILPTGSSTFFDFDSLANLYPTNTYTNIKVRVKGWCNYVYDVTKSNDSTGTAASQSPVKDSYYTPAAPSGHDTTLAYGTWGEVTAEQDNNRAIRWYRDTTQNPFYNPTQYNASRKWSNTPQYFHDSTYYLNALSDKNCPSYYSPVTVHVAPRKARDMAIEAVLAPLGSRVYMENDTVRVRVANYGTTAQSNIPIKYELKRGNNVIQSVTETIAQSLAPDQTYEFTFDSLLAIPTPTTQQNYVLNVWTDLPNDATRRNDTLRTTHTFRSLAEDLYSSNGAPTDENTDFDITRVSFNAIDIDMPPLNRRYTNFASYANPEYPVLHVTRGMSDSLFVEVSPIDPSAQRFRCRGTVMIDYNRTGSFTNPNSSGPNPVIASDVVFYNDTVFVTPITIPDNASLGYMRMRIKVTGYVADSPKGHVVDFLLFVDEAAPIKDLAITQMVSPRSPLVRNNQPLSVSLRLSNRGSTAINGDEAPIHYQFVHDPTDEMSVLTLPWTGTLAPGASMVVQLPATQLETEGTYEFRAWHEMTEDVNTANDTLTYEYHKFHTIRLPLSEDFEGVDKWYAPKGRSEYTRNVWQRGMPTKNRIDTTYSGDFAWVTDLNNIIVTGKRGNVSYLYTPVINIASIRPDTIYFRLRRNLISGSALYMEYFSSDNKWLRVSVDSCNTWYNDQENQVFSGTSSNAEGYALYAVSTKTLRNDFQERCQFRFVYTTPMGSSTNSSYGEGCAIDDFRIGRAPRPVDVGVVGFASPTAPQYGQTVYPEVIVKNYGTDTIRSFNIGYMHYGSYLAKENGVTCAIGPGDLDTFRFESPFVITSDYPDSFHIIGFTYRADDIYIDNDTMQQMFYMVPLDNDISAEEFLAPLDHVVAGDTAVRVTLRIRNNGLTPISTATATYVLNNTTRVEEQIDFEQLLGRPLESLEFYNYTFQTKIRATMGIMSITGYIKSPVNDYIYNDTVSKRFEGIMAITDAAASAVMVDMSSHEHVYIAVIIENRGARGINNFEVGFWYDYDTNTMVRETYYRAEPIPALATGYHRFSAQLPTGRPYDVISAYVHVANDNDPGNDTTDVKAEPYSDVEFRKLLVEENASDDCRVFAELVNVGNLAIIGKTIPVRASINGSDQITTNREHNLLPSQVIHIQLSRRIPKSPTREYTGTGWLGTTPGDNNQANDQTSIVEVINYFEDVPTVNGANFVLEQNYPNPFSHQTTVPFTIPVSANVRFFVMDAMGHIVYSDERFCMAGDNSMVLDMEAFAAGVYYYGIEVDGQRQMRKMILR